MNLIQIKKTEVPLPEITKEISLEKSPEVKQLIFNLQYGDSLDFEALVKVEEKVKAGQVIAKTENGFSIHTPLSGIISKIEDRYSSFGDKTPAIVLDVKKDKASPNSISDKTPKDAQSIISQLLMGGVNTPWTISENNLKKSKSKNNEIKKVIINGVDEDPGFINNRMILKNQPEVIEESLKIIKILVPEAKLILAVEEADYVRINDRFGKFLVVLPVPYTYLDRLEHYIVNRVYGTKRPAWKAYSEDGIMLISAENVLALHEAVNSRTPHIKKRITVFGDILDTPRYVEIFYGTMVRDVFNALDITVEEGDRVHIGGPMKGMPQFDLDTPLNMFSNGIYVQRDSKKSFIENYPCTNCGFCTRICPENLQVHLITRNSEFRFFEKALELDAGCCTSCGLCNYVCPAHRPLVHYMKFALDEAIVEKENGIEG